MSQPQNSSLETGALLWAQEKSAIAQGDPLFDDLISYQAGWREGLSLNNMIGATQGQFAGLVQASQAFPKRGRIAFRLQEYPFQSIILYGRGQDADLWLRSSSANQESLIVETEPSSTTAYEPPQLEVPGRVKALFAIFDRWNIGSAQVEPILGASDARFIADLRAGAESLRTRDMQDRARYIFDIYEGVFNLLRDIEAERRWIRLPRVDLQGHSVLDLMVEGSQFNLIRALRFVDFVSGR